MSQHTHFLYPDLLAVCVGVWYQQVKITVHEPYLDEYFHIRQAKVYCAGNFTQWDPKITTPPGLYILSYLLYLAGQGCDIPTLRQTNASGIFFTWIPLFLLLKQQHKQQPGSRVHAAHTALNVCLFPPLFFFSALYYTDVVSTEVVLWSLYLRRNETLKGMPFRRGMVLIFVGVAALCFRQTNVFWVAIFGAGSDAVEVLQQTVDQSQKSGSVAACERGGPSGTIMGTMKASWRGKMLYDVPVQDACFEDYILTVISLMIMVSSSSKYLRTIIMAILPQLVILVLFVVFVVWNGGVVLGDKSNHVATVHAPQMLYIWPYIMFFSLPVVLFVTYQRLSLVFSSQPQPSRTNIQTTPQYSSIQLVLPTTAKPGTYMSTRLLLFLLFTALGLLVVHYNTIIHPFTLADNRHYVFYVFKILRMHWSIKYLAVPAYIVSAWVVLGAIGGSAAGSTFINGATTFAPARHNDTQNAVEGNAVQAESKAASITRTSFVLIWLATTTLTLITAPLVEPRYYIIPWLVWRVHVLPASSTQRSAKLSSHLILWSETAWLLLINVITGYVFLHRDYEWPQEPGVVQRFLW